MGPVVFERQNREKWRFNPCYCFNPCLVLLCETISYRSKSMSRLPSAPLIEVIFDVRWPMETEEALSQYAYLPGELYGRLKDQYPARETLPAALLTVDQARGFVAHRFRVAAGQHPLVQLGPGILTVNTTDSSYEWSDFEERSLYAVKEFLQINPAVEGSSLSLNLVYLDFLPFDFESDDIQAYLESNLHITLKQSFFDSRESAKGIQLTLSFRTEGGLFTFSIQQAVHLNQQGLMLQFAIAHHCSSDLSSIQAWLDRAHSVCSNAFKTATKGELYHSFSQIK